MVEVEWELEPSTEPIDGDLARDLLAERSKLLEGCDVCGSQGARRDADALKRCEDSIKRLVDKNGGVLVDEEHGKITYDHSQTRVGWDEKRLQELLGPYYNELEWDVRQSSLDAVLKAHGMDISELKDAAKFKPRKGPITVTPLPRSIRDT